MIKSVVRYYLLTICYLLFAIRSTYAAPYHSITIDGKLNEWSSDEVIAADGIDSVWNPLEGTNEIKNIYATWDKSNLYIAIEGVATDKGMILFIDSGQNKGFEDLREINTWNRRVSFSGGFAPDFFFAAWGNSDGNFYRLSSSSTVEDLTSRCIVKAPYSSSSKSGWEIKIPFDLIYSRGDSVPYGVVIKVFASLATGDVSSGGFGAYGYLGGDCVPDDNITGLNDVVVSTWTAIMPDAKNTDGIPDDNFKDISLTFKSVEVSPVRFAPYLFSANGSLSTALIKVETTKEATVSADVYDIAGRKIKSLPEKDNSSVGFSKTFVWDGCYVSGDVVPRGVYIVSIRATNGSESLRINKSIVIIR